MHNEVYIILYNVSTVVIVVQCYNEYSLGSTSDTKVGNRGWGCCKFNDMLRSIRFDENVFN